MATKERRDQLIQTMEHLGPVSQSWRERLRLGVCPMCGIDVDETDFRDESSRKEYALSHMCQSCQDEIFRPE